MFQDSQSLSAHTNNKTPCARSTGVVIVVEEHDDTPASLPYVDVFESCNDMYIDSGTRNPRCAGILLVAQGAVHAIVAGHDTVTVTSRRPPPDEPNHVKTDNAHTHTHRPDFPRTGFLRTYTGHTDATHRQRSLANAVFAFITLKMQFSHLLRCKCSFRIYYVENAVFARITLQMQFSHLLRCRCSFRTCYVENAVFALVTLQMPVYTSALSSRADRSKNPNSCCS